MNIAKTIKKEKKNDLILLCRQGEGLETYLADQKQRSYVNKRFSQEKDTVLLNQLDHIILVARLGKENTTLNERLEQARKAGYGVHLGFDLEPTHAKFQCGEKR